MLFLFAGFVNINHHFILITDVQSVTKVEYSHYLAVCFTQLLATMVCVCHMWLPVLISCKQFM